MKVGNSLCQQQGDFRAVKRGRDSLVTDGPSRGGEKQNAVTLRGCGVMPGEPRAPNGARVVPAVVQVPLGVSVPRTRRSAGPVRAVQPAASLRWILFELQSKQKDKKQKHQLERGLTAKFCRNQMAFLVFLSPK